MTGSPRSGSPYDPAEPISYPYQAPSDPAYAGNYPYAGNYSGAGVPPGPAPTEQLAPYWTQTYGPPPQGMPPQQEPPQPPGAPRWLWLLAGVAVTLVIGLVVVLVIANTRSRDDTVLAPLPSMPPSTSTTPRTTPPTTTRPPIISIPPLPLPTQTPPTQTTGPTQPPAPGTTETVVYEVTGEGRAINITYVDGNVMQTEFNVVLPWRMEVDLPSPAANSASVTVINVGRDVTCTISIDGVQVDTRTGAGLTICAGR